MLRHEEQVEHANHSDRGDEGADRRCRLCQHPLSAARSLERGVGPVCARRANAAAVLELPAVEVIVVKLCGRCIREAS